MAPGASASGGRAAVTMSDERGLRGEGGATDLARSRQLMLEAHLMARGIVDATTLRALASVPRERFVPEALRPLAYADQPLPIGFDQTISQPYIVALMTQLAAPGPGQRVLEVGTGCGYQTAVLCATGAEVLSVEIVPQLAEAAASCLKALGLAAQVRVGDGHAGWPERAPFDAIVVTAAPRRIPRALVAQLAPGGRLVVPVGRERQSLVVVQKTPQGLCARRVARVRFVPMTGASFTERASFDIL